MQFSVAALRLQMILLVHTCDVRIVEDGGAAAKM